MGSIRVVVTTQTVERDLDFAQEYTVNLYHGIRLKKQWQLHNANRLEDLMAWLNEFYTACGVKLNIVY